MLSTVKAVSIDRSSAALPAMLLPSNYRIVGRWFRNVKMDGKVDTGGFALQNIDVEEKEEKNYRRVLDLWIIPM